MISILQTVPKFSSARLLLDNSLGSLLELTCGMLIQNLAIRYEPPSAIPIEATSTAAAAPEPAPAAAALLIGGLRWRMSPSSLAQEVKLHNLSLHGADTLARPGNWAPSTPRDLLASSLERDAYVMLAQESQIRVVIKPPAVEAGLF